MRVSAMKTMVRSRESTGGDLGKSGQAKVAGKGGGKRPGTAAEEPG